jgi:uncharacterized alpha-E superfamily protein
MDKAKWPFEMRGANGRRLLTYDEATPEQIAAARAWARRAAAEVEAKFSPEYWSALRARVANMPPRWAR